MCWFFLLLLKMFCWLRSVRARRGLRDQDATERTKRRAEFGVWRFWSLVVQGFKVVECGKGIRILESRISCWADTVGLQVQQALRLGLWALY